MKAFLPVFLFIIITPLLKAQTSLEPVLPGYIHLIDSVPCTSVKDQSQSPTCWAFGSNSLFESDLIKKYGLSLNLSEMFMARYAYIDKKQGNGWLQKEKPISPAVDSFMM
jgi:C1A family cysteine protease